MLQTSETFVSFSTHSVPYIIEYILSSVGCQFFSSRCVETPRWRFLLRIFPLFFPWCRKTAPHWDQALFEVDPIFLHVKCNSKFLEFSQLHLYIHLVIFHFVISSKILESIFFFALKKNGFWRKWWELSFSHKYWHFLFQICNQYALIILRSITCHVCRSKIRDVEKLVPHLSHFRVSATSRLLQKRLCN